MPVRRVRTEPVPVPEEDTWSRFFEAWTATFLPRWFSFRC